MRLRYMISDRFGLVEFVSVDLVHLCRAPSWSLPMRALTHGTVYYRLSGGDGATRLRTRRRLFSSHCDLGMLQTSTARPSDFCPRMPRTLPSQCPSCHSHPAAPSVTNIYTPQAARSSSPSPSCFTMPLTHVARHRGRASNDFQLPPFSLSPPPSSHQKSVTRPL